MSTVSSNNPAAAVHHYSAGLSPNGVAIDPVVGGLRRSAWVKIGVVALLFLAVFWPNVARIWGKVNPFTGDPNWQHGVFVPLVGIYFLYVNREELLRAPVRPSWVGLVVLLGGLLVSMYSVWPLQNDFVWDFGMVLTLFGAVLLLCGWRVMRTAWFPIAFLVCAIPWPGLFYSMVAGPLQELASWVAVKVMQVCQIEAWRSGTKMFYAKDGDVRALNVAEACAGLRSLMTFISLGGAVAFLSDRPLWQRILVCLSAVPIAIFCNVMRVGGQGVIDYYVSQEFSAGFAHTFFGLIMLIPAFFLLLGVGWVLDHLFIDEADEQEKAKLASAARAKLIIAAGPKLATAGAAGASHARQAPAPVAPQVAAALALQAARPPAAATARVAAKAAVAVPAVKPGASVQVTATQAPFAAQPVDAAVATAKPATTAKSTPAAAPAAAKAAAPAAPPAAAKASPAKPAAVAVPAAKQPAVAPAARAAQPVVKSAAPAPSQRPAALQTSNAAAAARPSAAPPKQPTFAHQPQQHPQPTRRPPPGAAEPIAPNPEGTR